MNQKPLLQSLKAANSVDNSALRYATNSTIRFAIKLVALVAIITPASSQLYAQQIYKSVDKNGNVLIYDSFDQTSYEMTKKDFNDTWGGGVISRAKSK